MLNTFVPFLLLLNAIVPINAQSFAFEIGTEENQFEIRPPFFNLDLKKETGVSLLLWVLYKPQIISADQNLYSILATTPLFRSNNQPLRLHVRSEDKDISNSITSKQTERLIAFTLTLR